jgi:hypothetical protein
MTPDRYPINAQELADELRVPGKWLRHQIRRHKLAKRPAGRAEYELYADDVQRIVEHPVVRGRL